MNQPVVLEARDVRPGDVVIAPTGESAVVDVVHAGLEVTLCLSPFWTDDSGVMGPPGTLVIADPLTFPDRAVYDVHDHRQELRVRPRRI